MRCAIAPHGLEFDEDPPVGTEADAVLGERRAEEIATEVFQAGAIVGGDPDVGVEIEAVELGLTLAAGGNVAEVRLGAEPADAGAGAGAEGNAALDGGPNEPGQDERDFGERVCWGGGVGRFQVVAGEQSPHACADGGEDLADLGIGWRGGGVKRERAGPSLAEDAVEHERVEVERILSVTRWAASSP